MSTVLSPKSSRGQESFHPSTEEEERDSAISGRVGGGKFLCPAPIPHQRTGEVCVLCI